MFSVATVRCLILFTLVQILLAASACALEKQTQEEAVSFLADWTERCLSTGEKPTVWLTALGQRKLYTVMGVDSRALIIDIEKNPFPMKWRQISPEELAGVAKSLAGASGERLVVAAEVALMLGFPDKACEALMLIRNPDDDLRQKIAHVAVEIAKVKPTAVVPPPPPKKKEPETPKTPPGAAPASVSVVMPVINGPVINVGPTRNIKTITAAVNRAKAGDTILVDLGTYNEVFKMRCKGTANAPVTLRGVVGPKGERPVLDAAGISVSGAGPVPRAIIQVEGDYCVIDSLELKNARNGNNGSGLRFINCNNTLVRNCKITYCDMGLMGGDDQTLSIQRCEVAFNGTQDYNGYSHNFYMLGNRLVVQECYIHDSLFGQNFKTRGHYTELWYNFIADSQEGEIGMPDSDLSGLPNSHAVLVGNVVVSKANRTGNAMKFIAFGGEGKGRQGNLYLFNNTFVAATPRIRFVWCEEPGNDLVACNNIFYGSSQIAVVGGKIKGSNNFMSGNVPGLANPVGSGDPGFLNPGANDFHLLPNSRCLNMGVPPDLLVYLDGEGKERKALPALQVVFPMNSQPRPKKATLDVGAFGL